MSNEFSRDSLFKLKMFSSIIVTGTTSMITTAKMKGLAQY